MRSDYALYTVALIFFAITIISFAVLSELERNLSVVATVVLGLLFVGLGYTQRPRGKIETLQASPSLPAVSPPPTIAEAVGIADQQKAETRVEPAPVMAEVAKIDLIAVKGVKARRAEQLKTLGIRSVEELANASAKDLAEKLKISAKFTAQWIENAKELLARS